MGGFGGDFFVLPEGEDDVVHEAHSILQARLHRIFQARGLAFFDEVLNRRVADENFAGEDDGAVDGREEALADDAAETLGDAGANLRLLRRRKHVEQAVEGRGGVAGVHCADDEVARLGGADRHLDGLEVAEFADDDDVGVFAEGPFEGGGEGAGVWADFALGDVAALGEVDDFDGVFDGDDVVGAGLVEVGDHRGEGGGLAGADGAGDENEAVVVGEEFVEGRDVLGVAEVCERARIRRDHAVGTGGAVLVKHQVDAVAVDVAQGQGIIVVFFIEEDFFLVVGEQGDVEAEGVLRGEGIVGEEGERAIFPDERTGTSAEMEVAGAVVGGGAEQGAEGGGQCGVAERLNRFEGECSHGAEARGRRRGWGVVGTEVGGKPAGMGGSAGLNEGSLSRVVVERVGSRGTVLAFGEGEVGKFFKRVEIGDDAGVDEALGEGHHVAAGAESVTDLEGLGAGEEALVDAESGEPAGVVVHAWRGALGSWAEEAGQAKREGDQGERWVQRVVNGGTMTSNRAVAIRRWHLSGT